jgi:hypothetical protein
MDQQSEDPAKAPKKAAQWTPPPIVPKPAYVKTAAATALHAQQAAARLAKAKPPATPPAARAGTRDVTGDSDSDPGPAPLELPPILATEPFIKPEQEFPYWRIVKLLTEGPVPGEPTKATVWFRRSDGSEVSEEPVKLVLDDLLLEAATNTKLAQGVALVMEAAVELAYERGLL